MTFAREIWNSLEEKYTAEKEGADKFITFKFFEFAMEDNVSILDQVHEFLILISKFKNLNIEIAEKLLIQKHLRTKKETHICEKNLNSASCSKVNYVDSGKNNKENDKKRKGTWNSSKDNKKDKKPLSEVVCYKCGEKEHIKRYCKNPKRKNQNSNKKDGSAKAMEQVDTTEITAMVSEMNIGMIQKLHMASVITTDDWWYDSGATTHVCNNRDLFKTYKETEDGHEVIIGDNHTSKVIGSGNVEIQFTSEKKLTLMNVLHVSNIRKNLVSSFKLCKSEVKVVIESDKVILSKANVFVGKAYACDGMFKLNINKITSSAYFLNCNFISSFNIECSAFNLWHNRLGHINYRTMKDMLKQGIISNNGEHKDKCEICVQAEMKRKPFPKVDRQSEILELVHSDICELNGQLTRGGNRYFITFIDDFSRYTYVYLWKSKDQAFETFKIYKAEVENQKGKKIQILKSDRGGEYFSTEFSSYCESQGLIDQRTTPYTPQQNGVAERKNKGLQDMINTMLVSANLPKNLWGEALLIACHVSNRTTAKKLKVSPYEVWNGRKPNISYFRVWGCLAYYKVSLPNTSKLGPRGLKSIFVGYAKDSKSYRCLDLDSNVIIESRDVDFFENKFRYDSTSTNKIATQIPQDISDDILIVGTNMKGINETKKFLSSCFQMKDMNEVDTILGIKEANTLFESSCKLVENDGRAVAQIEYASAIGCLMYATYCTRLDIAYVVCKLLRYTSNPSQHHWKAIGRIFGYIKRTRQLALYYDRFPAVLEGYSDASWITGSSDSKSTIGWIFTLGCGAVCWGSKKQTCITHSTMDAEFLALTATSKEAEWLRNMLLDKELWPQLMPAIFLHCDSQSTLSRAYNKVYNGKSRHIKLRHAYIKELISNWIITIEYIRSCKNLADPFTKGLPKDIVFGTTKEIGLKFIE
nr:zinc finger, CCHC-type [Tanacetum cinerariifolium]